MDKSEKDKDEIYRLAGSPPLITILKLMIGPLCSQITSAMYGIINSIWISKYLGDIGMAAVATDIAWEGIARGFGLFLLCAGSTQISALFGKGQFVEAEQVICDILRTALICGMIVPCILLPINKPCSKWYGANKETIESAFQYILPQCAGNCFTCIFLGCCGFLQAEGRTLLVGIIDLVSLGVGMGVLNPLFLGTFKFGVRGPSISTIIADGVPGVTLTILYFCGVFSVKPKLSGLLKPFSGHTYKALVVGSSQLMSQISINLPGIIVRKLIGQSVSSPAEYDLAMGGFNVLCRFNAFTNCIILALCSGYLPPASYAFAAQKIKRYVRLTIHLNWISFVWCAFTMTLSMSIPDQISSLFGSGEGYLKFAREMLIFSNVCTFILFTRLTFQSILQAQQNGIRAMIISLVSNFAAIILFSYVLYLTNKQNASRLMYVYPISYAIGFILGIFMLIQPFKQLKLIAQFTESQKTPDNEEAEEEETYDSVEGDDLAEI
ncbi:hypothetical protein TVAG_143310 [Trichomonas vaginalis G3]|uniref:MatE family protein n=1 Tax=Trichomonas vaginalis (strain ATCC PRA-98 / G3) TaxID=412133 RepID=A2EWC7_TRIV3|nr:multidrug resistance protein YPNP-related family [Trichomonas vaginalis G3]EAY03031.1 hypothetical protein TVAG_143310 [Trichomonas vaginalis G3]KAI5531454.1 multidrug resistance protein YPNP-related family [Trichomonas vaginalis G3]|eukprot:XP_001315254.1 hypothetical protein [Trichomonas vaginalis G3]